MSEKPEKGKTKKPATEGSLMTAVRKRERKVRFFFVFFMGVIMTTVGAVMLFGSEELSTKMLFIWALWLMTGLGLLAVGFIGLWVRYSDTKLEGSPRDDQNDQPEKSE